MTWTRSQRRCAWPWSQTKNLRRGITLAGLVLGGLLHSAAQTPSHGGVNDPNTKDLGRAQRLLEQHHLQEARAVLNNIVETHPSADGYLLLADVAREQNDLRADHVCAATRGETGSAAGRCLSRIQRDLW